MAKRPRRAVCHPVGLWSGSLTHNLTGKESYLMVSREEKERILNRDSDDEGRKGVMRDIDRMVNEGMAGGRVHRDQIEETTEVPEEK